MSTLLLISVVLCGDPSIQLEVGWTAQTQDKESVLEFSADGESVWVSAEPADGLPRLQNLTADTGVKTDRQMAFPGRVVGIRFFDDGAVSVAGNHVIWWDAALKVPVTHELAMRPTAFAATADASVVAVACGEINYGLPEDDENRERGELVIVGSSKPDEIKTVVDLKRPPIGVGLSADGETIAVVHPYKNPILRVFSRSGEEQTVKPSLLATDISRIAFSPTASEIFVGKRHSPSPVARFSLDGDDDLVPNAKGSSRAITAMAVSDDGELVVTGCLTDGLFGTYYAGVEVWDATTLQSIGRYTTRPFGKPYVTAVRFSPNGKRLAILEADGKLLMMTVERTAE